MNEFMNCYTINSVVHALNTGQKQKSKQVHQTYKRVRR